MDLEQAAKNYIAAADANAASDQVIANAQAALDQAKADAQTNEQALAQALADLKAAAAAA